MLIKERSRNKQLAINMGASLITFVVGLGINFFLTPYIVGSLGAAAYGFVGLSSNVLGYTSLITIALNSMAGRFITISYQQGKIKDANQYFSSVFYSNLLLAGVISLLMGGCVFYLEYIFEIPNELVWDVKLLFSFLLLNTIIGLLTNIYAVAIYIKNRLELSSIRSFIGSIGRGIFLVLMFGFLHPCIWYLGFSSLLVTLYSSYTNFRFTRILTPELRINRKNYDFGKVKELILSGLWNLVNKLSEMLAQGLDLVLVNLFIGVVAMGTLSLTKTVPMLILSLVSTISGVFAPTFTKLYAEGRRGELKNELLKSIRILGFFATIPMVCFYAYGADFYHLWLPTQDANELQMLSIIGTLGMIFSMPLEALWNIFTITNKLRYNTIFIFFQNLLSFSTIWCILFFVEGIGNQLYVFVVTRFIFSFAKNMYLLPLHGARCLDLPWTTFYPTLFKSLLCFSIAMFPCFILHRIVPAQNWLMLFVLCGICVIICIGINYFVILQPSDRLFIKTKILRK